MQLRKMVVMLTALGAMSLVMTGCPEGGENEVGMCTADTDCLSTEICHPTAKTCVQTCTSSADCTANAKTCAAVEPGSTTQVCQCSTDQLCNQDRATADQVCSTVDKVCVKACAADTDCPTGRACDAATGQCKAAVTDACNGQCKTGETCDTSGTTPTCKAPVGATCTGTAQSTCTYGSYCSTGGTCTAVPAPTCVNFDPSRGGKQPVWTAATGTGPIIYEITQVSWAPDTNTTNPFCGRDAQSNIKPVAKARVKAYNASGTFPSTKSGLSGLFYVRTDAQLVDATGLIRPSEYSTSDGGKNAEFIVNFCPPDPALTSLPVGLYFTGGNEICGLLTK